MIYNANQNIRHAVAWSDWVYFGEKGQIKKDVVLNSVASHFKNIDLLYISHTRTNSFQIGKENFEQSVEDILGVDDFFVWDEKFKLVIEFNRIGVMKTGIVS